MTECVFFSIFFLLSYSLPLEAPIVVIGDASGSMEVAIRTSTIIASLLTAITSARLVFFNTETRDAPFLPKTIEEVCVCVCVRWEDTYRRNQVCKLGGQIFVE